MRVFLFLILSSSFLFAEHKFYPFESKFSGEYVDGYKFWDITYAGDGFGKVEVMIVADGGRVFFPLDVNFTLDMLNVFYKETSLKNKGARFEAIRDLIYLIIPRSTPNMIVYPSLQIESLDRLARYLNLPVDQVKGEAVRWNGEIAKKCKKKKNERVIHISALSGHGLRNFTFFLSKNGDVIEKVEYGQNFVFK